MSEVYETYVKNQSNLPGVMREYFRCECGRELPATHGECDHCGAHYEPEDGGDGMEQTVPPIEARLPDGERG